ncbi:hypothetical protein C8Q70DRAFT_1091230, partial [Cubamyces menziesii]
YRPDKAIDLVDDATSALRLAQESKPDDLQALNREIMTLGTWRESLKDETDIFSIERRRSSNRHARRSASLHSNSLNLGKQVRILPLSHAKTRSASSRSHRGKTCMGARLAYASPQPPGSSNSFPPKVLESGAKARVQRVRWQCCRPRNTERGHRACRRFRLLASPSRAYSRSNERSLSIWKKRVVWP